MLYIPLTSGHILRGNKINMLKRHLYSYVYCSIIHKNEGTESKEPEVIWLIRNDVFPRETVVSGYPKRHSSADLWERVDLSSFSPVMFMA